VTATKVPATNCAFVGYSDGPVEGVNCDRPKKLLTAGDVLLFARCRRTDGTCEPCASSYRRDVGRIARRGMLLPGRSYFLTLTAPGDRVHFLPNGDPCSCTPPGGVDLPTWNGECVARWNHLKRDLETLWGVPFVYFKAVEVQKRGALHLHVIVRVLGPALVQKADVRRLAVHHGFGHSVDLEDLTTDGDCGRAAGYCAKYCAKSCTERHVVPFVNCRTGEIGPGRWRTWTASRAWGASMKSMRAEQAAWWDENGHPDGNPAGAGAPSGDTDTTGAAGGVAALDPYRASYTPSPARPSDDLGPVLL
jgi:hypothetical protein